MLSTNDISKVSRPFHGVTRHITRRGTTVILLQKMLQIIRTHNVHYHGIIHAFGMTILVILQKEFGVGLSETISKNELFYTIFHTGIPAAYLFFAIWRYCLKTGKNTILTNFHAGVVISFIHPFVYNFFRNIYQFQTISFLGVSVRYMVSLMVISLPVAAAVYLIYRYFYPETEGLGRDDILDDGFL